LLEENDGQGTAKVDYIYLDNRPVATVQPTDSMIYFLHDDRLGAPQLATDASQTVQWSANYQPSSQTDTTVGLITQNLRLPGQELDLETGLYHNGFRDYAPELGRYLESDPVGLAGGLNTYLYVNGNPLRRMDYTGLCSTDEQQPGGVYGGTVCFPTPWTPWGALLRTDL
jgi:RHS repeat-associated protein